MASMRDIKRRKASIQSTGQITKAMKLVSTVKLQKAKSRAEQARPYSKYMYDTIVDMLSRTKNINHPYLNGDADNPKKAVIVITSNRGLAGGYNNNAIKLLLNSDMPKENVEVYAIGKKGKDALQRRGYEIKADYSEVINEPEYADAKAIGEVVLKEYTEGNIGEIYLIYTSFKNTVSHEPKLMKLLPISMEDVEEEETEEKLAPMTFEPDEDEILDAIIPKYMNSLIYGALVEAVASENGARMQAMDSATSNAEEMIADLSLKYNRARQGAITQELTEIIAGAEAIN